MGPCLQSQVGSIASSSRLRIVPLLRVFWLDVVSSSSDIAEIGCVLMFSCDVSSSSDIAEIGCVQPF